MLVDYHVHGLAHGEYKYSYEWIHRYLDNALLKGIKEIGFAEHEEYASLIDFDLIEQLRQEHNEIKIRVGLEVDYIPEREPIIRDKINAKPYDYIIGSVHFLNGWAFDHPDYKDRFEGADVDDIYRAYFSTVDLAVKSGLFDIIGHIDLIKKWGHRPVKQSSLDYVVPVLNSIRANGLVMEINSSGLRKPIGETYPSLEVLRQAFYLKVLITFGSDAHNPQELGEQVQENMQLAQQLGFRHFCTFKGRKLQLVPINML